MLTSIEVHRQIKTIQPASSAMSRRRFRSFDRYASEHVRPDYFMQLAGRRLRVGFSQRIEIGIVRIAAAEHIGS